MMFEQSLSRPDRRPTGSLAAYMGLSLGCHAVLMAFLIAFSGFNGCRRQAVFPSVIDVDLVSLPDASPGGRPSAPAGRQEAPSPAAAVPPKPSRAVAVPTEKAPVDQVKTALKKKTYQPDQSVEKAIARLEKQAAKQKDQGPPSDSVAQAISRMKQAEQDSRQSVKVSGAGGSGAGGGVIGGRSRKELEAIDVYKLEIRYHILKNWVFSSQLAGNDKELRTVIGITIAADGHITDTWFDHRSGNRYYDDSAHKAVLKSNPLPRLPQGFKTYTVGLEFTPSDLR